MIRQCTLRMDRLADFDLRPPAAQILSGWKARNRRPRTSRCKAVGWGRTELLSGGKWLLLQIEQQDVAKKLPKEGALLGYQFQVSSAGNYEVWSRIGWEGIRSPFDWRIDQGPWHSVKPDYPTTDHVELAFWCPLGWMKLGADRPGGRQAHAGVSRLGVVQEGKWQRRCAGDHVCLRRDVPHARSLPAQRQAQARRGLAGREATSRRPGRSSSSPTAARTRRRSGWSFRLAGLWQVGRFDEQEVVDRTGPTHALPDAGQVFWMGTNVPSNKFKDRPELPFCHRLIYRTRVEVPAELGRPRRSSSASRR